MTTYHELPRNVHAGDVVHHPTDKGTFRDWTVVAVGGDVDEYVFRVTDPATGQLSTLSFYENEWVTLVGELTFPEKAQPTHTTVVSDNPELRTWW